MSSRNFQTFILKGLTQTLPVQPGFPCSFLSEITHFKSIMIVFFHGGLKHSVLCTIAQWFSVGITLPPRKRWVTSMHLINVQSMCSHKIPWLEGPYAWFNAPLSPLIIANNFIFELTFCTWSLMEQWSMCVNRGEMCSRCGSLSLPPH